MSKYKKNQSGFTLIEMLLTMAIIAILAGAILISLEGQRKKANQGKLLAEMSGTIQPMLMCKSDGNTVQNVTSSGNICSVAAYGKWPSTTGTGFGAYESGNLNAGNWWFHTQDGTARICCNGVSSKCHTLANGATCNATTPAQ